jgi:pimeloyl-ACP methyl ester carboxylesterase
MSSGSRGRLLAAVLSATLILLPHLSHGQSRAPIHEISAENAVGSTRYRAATIEGLKIFYREAGVPTAPAVVLLHGFPASSFMYRDLMERLSDRYYVLAPDYPGFGYSDAPPPSQFPYTFDRLTDIVQKLTEQLGVTKYALYMQDFGGPVGFRLATRHPERVTALVVQNANAYEAGLPDSFWAPARALWTDPSSENFLKIRESAMSDEALEWNYTHGVRDPDRISPDSWVLQRALLNRPGNKDVMLRLIHDYRTNLDRYPEWQTYFRKYQPPTLITWGANDQIFPPSGARPYLQDLPKAQLHLLETGHFALEDKADEIAELMRGFLGKHLSDSR